VLSRFGPLGLSVLALLASFVIVLTAGGVLATSSNPAPPPPTPRAPELTTVEIDIAALQAGRDVDVPQGVTATLRTTTPPPLGTSTATSGPATSGGQAVTLLCLTLSDQWSLPRQSRAWTKDGRVYCRSIDPGQQPEVPVVLERTR
jgi:hypothetical protein